MTDNELLEAWVARRSDPAFAELARRYVDVVYSAALRQVRDPALAEDVVQAVFLVLARKAASLRHHALLAGWLYRTTRFIAIRAIRSEARRRRHEQEAMNMPPYTFDSKASIAPLLDEAMSALPEADRNAVLLRFFQAKPMGAVGEHLGISEDAAKKRVSRAVEKLRSFFVHRGVTLSAAALTGALTHSAVQAAPLGLVARVTAAQAGSAASGGAAALADATLRQMLWFKLRSVIVCGAAALVAIVIPAVWHWEGPNRRVVTPPQSAASASDVPATQPAAAATSDTPATQDSPPAIINARLLRLTILAADARKPLAAVDVECTVKKDQQQTREKFISRRDGICDVYYPKDTDALELVSRTDGFADTILHWEPTKGDTIPTNYGLRLIRAIHIGGYVREEDGSPVPGAKVAFNRNVTRDDPVAALAHENHEFKRIEIAADAEGRWSLDRIAPATLGRTTGFVMEPDHLVKAVAFDNLNEKGAQELLREGRFVFKLSRGVTVQGVVVDKQGKPVPKAKVVVGKLGKGEFRETTTLEDGSYVAKACRPGETCVAVSAKGFATRVLDLNLAADFSPLNITLESGRALRLKVVNQAGQPVAKAMISANLSESTLAHLGKSDTNGLANVQAPSAGTITIRVSAGGYAAAEVEVTADGQEHSIVLTKEMVLSGIVTDATTGRPIPQFRLICGTPHFGRPFSTNASFTPSPISEDWFKFGNGQFRLPAKIFLQHNGDVKERGFMIKFEADGYAPCVSRLIRCEEGDVQLAAALLPAKSVKVTVLNPNGRPAANADVGLLGEGTPLTIKVERLQADIGSALLQTDSEGAFQLPPDASIERVIAINAQGFAATSPSALSGEPTLQLQPFGRLVGRWLVRNQPSPQQKLLLEFEDQGTGAGLRLELKSFSAVTDDQGHFVFPHVPPGKFHLTHPVPEGNGVTSLKPVADAIVRPGETTTVGIGEGYIVSLRLRWPADFTPTRSTRTGVFLHTPNPQPPTTILHDPQALAQWAQLPEVQAQLRAVRGYEFVEGADGSWTADAVPAGATYSLEARAVDEVATNGLPPFLAYGQMSVTIPAAPYTGQFDAGELILRPAK